MSTLYLLARRLGLSDAQWRGRTAQAQTEAERAEARFAALEARVAAECATCRDSGIGYVDGRRGPCPQCRPSPGIEPERREVEARVETLGLRDAVAGLREGDAP